jgi:hypothetical protein
MVNFIGLKECDQLEGVSNFIPWKCNLHMLMEEKDLWHIVEGKATVPTNPQQWIQYAKAERILDFVKDHLVPHVIGKLMKEMYEAFKPKGLVQLVVANVTRHLANSVPTGASYESPCVRRIFLDFVKDHLVPRVIGKLMKEMYEALKPKGLAQLVVANVTRDLANSVPTGASYESPCVRHTSLI